MTLDVDAFPLTDDWLTVLTGRLNDGAEVAGARLNRTYVHPCCCALRGARFAARGHSFRSHYQPRRPGFDASGDVGEELSAAEEPRLSYLEVTEQRGPGDVGTVFGDLVYHNFYADPVQRHDRRHARRSGHRRRLRARLGGGPRTLGHPGEPCLTRRGQLRRPTPWSRTSTGRRRNSSARRVSRGSAPPRPSASCAPAQNA